MASSDAWIAVDWGTSNRRAYLVGADGGVADTLSDDLDILSIPAGTFPNAVEELRRRFGVRAVVMTSMVGSNRGWAMVPYVDASADLDTVATAAVMVAPDAWIAPGVALRSGDRVDVMRGEEMQVLGAVAADMVGERALSANPAPIANGSRSITGASSTSPPR